MARLERFKVLDPAWRNQALSRMRGLFRRRDDGGPESTTMPKVPVCATAATQPPAADNTSSPRATLLAGAAEPELRRGEMRSRFDALFDRMLALEDTMDSLGKRFALRGVHERRAEQRLVERFDVLSESFERRALELEGLTTLLGRVEQRLERMERKLRNEESVRDVRPTDPDELSERLDSFATEPRRVSRPAPDDAAEFLDTAPFSASSMRGNLNEVSLPTILGMLELERRTGVLKVCADDGAIVSATLREGSIVGARVRDLDSEPIEAIREAIRFKHGHFWFRQVGVEVASGPPKSVGSVLLEATRQNDEALRSA
jgi:hypothetical protein